jgi:glycosyltransferase involved in cell wall biosynthesis
VSEVAARRAAPVRWVRVLDGVDHAPLEAPGGLVETITVPSLGGGPTGAAAARNRALPYLREGWVTPLDGDDALIGDAYVRFVERVETVGRMWGAAACQDIRETGEPLPDWPDTIRQERLPAGYFLDRRINRGDWAWVCAAMVIDTALVTHVGGWPQDPVLHRSEDTAFTAAVTACAPGVWHERAVYQYRKHDRSTTRQPGWTDLPENIELIADLATVSRARWNDRNRATVRN